MKICTKCKQELPSAEFRIMNKKTGKISSMCNSCKKEYDREYWAKNKHNKKGQKALSAKKAREKKRLLILTILKNSCCMDCKNDDWRVLEFDHKDRETKMFNIADCINKSLNEIKLELEKCEIVCANCHAIRTITQRNYYNFLNGK